MGPKETSAAVMRRRSAMHRQALAVGSWLRQAPLGFPDVPDVYDK